MTLSASIDWVSPPAAGVYVTVTWSPLSTTVSTLRRGEDVDAVLLVLAGELLRDVLVLHRQHALEELDDRDLDAVVDEDEGELHADRAGADDDDRLRQVAGEDLLLVRHDVAAELDAGQQADLRAGRDDRVVEGHALGGAVRLLDVDRVRVDEGAATVVLGDLVLLHQEVDALDVGVGDLAAAIPRGAEVERHVTRDAEQVGLVVEGVREVGVLEERLRGDAPDVQAHTAPVLLFDDGDREAELSASDGRDVTAGAGAENDDVVVRHASSLSVGGRLTSRRRGAAEGLLAVLCQRLLATRARHQQVDDRTADGGDEDPADDPRPRASCRLAGLRLGRREWASARPSRSASA